jgi:hypothetical protein
MRRLRAILILLLLALLIGLFTYFRIWSLVLKVLIAVVLALVGIFATMIWADQLAENRKIAREFKRLRSRREDVRESAAKKLGEIGSYVYDKQLAQALGKEKSPRVRIAIIEALGILSANLLADAANARRRHEGPPGPPVLTVDYGPDHYLKALREFIIPGLEKSLYSDDPNERTAALSILRQIDMPEARAVLAEAMDSMPDTVQFTARYPSQIWRSTSHSLSVYAHLQSNVDAIERDLREDGQETQEADRTCSSSRALDRVALKKGARMTIMPECFGVRFDGTMSFTVGLVSAWGMDRANRNEGSQRAGR